MEILSPVGSFPVRITRVGIKQHHVALEARMGAWRSEVKLDRADMPLVGTALGIVALSFVAGRVTAQDR
jgi:hypothetical protein